MPKKSDGFVFTLLFFLSGMTATVLEVNYGIFEETFYPVFSSPVEWIFFVIMLLALIVSNLLLRAGNHTRLCRFFNSVTIVISTAFSLFLLPVLWLLLLSVFAYGLGLLALIPYFVLALSTRQRFLIEDQTKPRVGIPILLGLLFFAVLIRTQLVLLPAETVMNNASPSIKNAYIRIVETVADRKVFRRECYEYDTFLSRIIPDRKRETNHELYYFVYGAQPGTATLDDGIWRERWNFDADDSIQSEWIGATCPGLHLESSAFDISADTARRVFQYRWEIVFTNESSVYKEAKAFIELPPFAVISGVILRVGEREFTAGEDHLEWWEEPSKLPKGTVTNQVIAETVGQDMIFLRVPSIAPDQSVEVELKLTGVYADRLYILLPRIQEMNFTVPDMLDHEITFSCTDEYDLYANGESIFNLTDDTNFSVTGELFSADDFRFVCQAEPPVYISEIEDLLEYDFAHISRMNTRPVLVIDGSYEVLSALKGLDWDKSAFQAAFIALPDGYYRWKPGRSLNLFIGWKRGFSAVDPTEALVAAFETADGINPTVVYLHGTRQVDFTSLFAHDAGCDDVRLVTYQIGDGVSPLYYHAEYMKHYHRCYALGDIETDVDRVTDIARMYFPDFVSIVEDGLYLGARMESGVMMVAHDDFIRSNPFRLYLYSTALSEWFDDGGIGKTNARLLRNNPLVTPFTPLSAVSYRRVTEPDIPDREAEIPTIPQLPERESFLIWR